MRDPPLKSPAATLVSEFAPLNRRRIHGPPLNPEERARWEALRDQLAGALGARPPVGAKRREALRVEAHTVKAVARLGAVPELLRLDDLSEAGLFLRTSNPAPPGTPIDLRLEGPGGHVLELEGMVVWTRAHDDASGPAGMGIALQALDDWDRALLSELVEAALRETLNERQLPPPPS